MSLKKVSICMILIIMILLSGCSQAKQYFDDIKVGMSYKEVFEIIGREPDECQENPGGQTDQIKYSWRFSDGMESLSITFLKTDPEAFDLAKLSVLIVRIYKPGKVVQYIQ